MRSTLLVLLSTCGAVSSASTCEADANSLLQSRSVVHGRAGGTDASALLTSGTSSSWTLVLQYGEVAYTMNSEAVGDLNEAVNGHAKLSDEAINALPSGGDAGYDYFMLTSDPPDIGASDSTTEWDTMFLRTNEVGSYDDEDNMMGLVSNSASWGVCNAASLDECTTWSTQHNSNGRFDIVAETGNNCNRWFTGYNGLKCYGYDGNHHNRQQRCFSRGASCAHRARTNVKIYKFIGAAAPPGLVTLHWAGGALTMTDENENVCLSPGRSVGDQGGYPNDALTSISGLRQGCQVDVYQHGCGTRRGSTTTLTSDGAIGHTMASGVFVTC